MIYLILILLVVIINLCIILSLYKRINNILYLITSTENSILNIKEYIKQISIFLSKVPYLKRNRRVKIKPKEENHNVSEEERKEESDYSPRLKSGASMD